MVLCNLDAVCCCLLTVTGFKGMSIATSGMGHDVLHISKVVKLAGQNLFRGDAGTMKLT